MENETLMVVEGRWIQENDKSFYSVLIECEWSDVERATVRIPNSSRDKAMDDLSHVVSKLQNEGVR